jgi:hypothetical protein
MKSVIRRFLMSGRPANQPMPWRVFFASSRIVVTLSSALLGSVGAPLAMAQGTLSVKAPISPEAMAMHVQAKRGRAPSYDTGTCCFVVGSLIHLQFSTRPGTGGNWPGARL